MFEEGDFYSRRTRELGRLRQLLAAVGVTLLVLLLLTNVARFCLLGLQRALALQGLSLTAAGGQLVSMVSYSFSMIGAILCGLAVFPDGPARQMPLPLPRPDYLLPAVGAALGLAMLANLLGGILLSWLQMLGWESETYLPALSPGFWPLLLSYLSTAVLPAFFEEILFRGVLLQPLRRYGDRFAVAVSAAAFCVCHTTLGQMPTALLMGLVLGVFTVRSGSLVTGIAIHFLYNSFAWAMTAVQWLLPRAAAGAVSGCAIGVAMAMALPCLLWLRWRFGPVFALAPRRNRLLATGDLFFCLCTSIPVLLAAGMYLYTTFSTVTKI